jgi:hypothetical protein
MEAMTGRAYNPNVAHINDDLLLTDRASYMVFFPYTAIALIPDIC